ncbi:MAG: hypothetical protein ABIS27_04720 [Longimicrobiales bacterium]
MAQPAQAVRVIYAKLTSTGDYDVVAKTDNIDLNAARSLAERLLLGNVPHDASIGEEFAYLRPPEGGHLLIRYTTYNWKDENRGGAFMTDIVWLNDSEFARARNNAFAMMPSSDDVYDVLTTLPPVDIVDRAAAQDITRMKELESAREALMNLAPAVLLGDRVLSVDRGDRRRKIELFTLLLPPRLRTELTFQTRAFRAPTHPPRITQTDEMHANLQGGPWQHVLPNVALDVPVGLASKVIDGIDHPDALSTAHDIYDRSGEPTDNLRAEATRLTGLVAFADALNAEDLTSAFRLAATGSREDAEAKLLAVFGRATPDHVKSAVMSSIDAGSDGEPLALQLLGVVGRIDAKSAAGLNDAAARRLVSMSRMPGSALSAHLMGALGRAGNANVLLLLVGVDPRTALANVPADLTEGATAGFVRALATASRNTRDMAAARQVVVATTALAPAVTEPAATSKLALLCRETVETSLEKATPERGDTGEIRYLQDAADVLLQSSTRMRDALPMLFSDGQLDGLSPAQAADLAATRAERLQPEAQGALAVALIARSSADNQDGGAISSAARERRMAAAKVLLEKLDPQMRARVQRSLEENGLGAETLLGVKGGEVLLPLLGRNAEQAASTRDLLQAVRDLGDSDDAIARLAMAVLAARNGYMVLTRSHQAFAPLKAALSDAIAKRKASSDHAAVLELTLDLLAAITDAEAFEELEQSAHIDGWVAMRLRRLDRAVALCRAAEDEATFEQLAIAIESPDTRITDASRQRLRDALGTGGLQRRIIQMITGVVERGVQ